MTPLNLYLKAPDDAQHIHAVREYGDAIRELVIVNIFAGDLLFTLRRDALRPRRVLRLR
jgi:isocitrate dehydrogenase kinase/phosphatase